MSTDRLAEPLTAGAAEIADRLAELDAEASGRLPYLDMRVIFDPATGRPELASHADQRDMSVGAKLADPDSDPIGFNRATAWAYLTRTGALEAMAWPEFNRDTAFVIPAEDPAEKTGADPTGPATAG